MAKPIFIISFPYAADLDSINQAYQDIDRKLGDDYHILTYRSPDNTQIGFQLFNATDATDAQIESIIEKSREELSQLFTEMTIAKELLKKSNNNE